MWTAGIVRFVWQMMNQTEETDGTVALKEMVDIEQSCPYRGKNTLMRG